MKENYIRAELEIFEFNEDDVITTSPQPGDDEVDIRGFATFI